MSLEINRWNAVHIICIVLHVCYSNGNPYFLCSMNIGSVRSKVVAQFSENGVWGTLTIEDSASNDVVLLSSSIYTSQNSVTQCSWTIHQFPVDYTLIDERCTDQMLGIKTVDLDSMFGSLKLNEETQLSASESVLSITGPQGIWQSSMLIVLPNGKRACSTLIVSDEAELKIGMAKFYGPVYGTVNLFWIGITGSTTDALIMSDLQHVRKRVVVNSEHNWGIFTTDSLDSSRDKARNQCNSLQLAYNGMNDMGKKLEKLKAGRRFLNRDSSLSPIDLYQKTHSYYIALYDDVHNDSFLTCSEIKFSSGITLRAYAESSGTRGQITLYQRSHYEPTVINVNIVPPQSTDLFRIHELPAIPHHITKTQKRSCNGIKNVFNPLERKVSFDGLKLENITQDDFAIGDISLKITNSSLKKLDIFLPLFGKYSVLHRSFVLYRKDTDTGSINPWICATLIPVVNSDNNQKLPMVSAEAVFRYPLAGRVIFRQLLDQPNSDTVIVVESLVYSDGSSLVDSLHLNWTINEFAPGKDYYNWQIRCNSTGNVYNPYKVTVGSENSFISSFNFGRFESTIGTLAIAGEKSKSDAISRHFMIHPNLHLSGPYSVIGRSLVMLDENGPDARGNRLACSKIDAINRRKAVVRDWFGNGNSATGSVMGKIELYQYSEYDTVDVEVDLTTLHDNSEYHVHMVSVQEELEFPCENSSLYGVWNPFNVSKLPRFYYNGHHGKSYDEYRAGDLSAKYGYLDNLSMLNAVYNDSTIQLFGQLSLLGRSVIIHEKSDNRRYACATIERGYATSDARELRAIASFHHPNGFAYGHVRMTQLVHTDGSKSDVVIEVNLRYPGKQNRNITHNHLWMVYVNPVSVDATVSAKLSRCTAGGYVFNPYFTQLADPINEELYFRECGSDHPLRCYAGDVSGRLGSISVGAERTVFSDPYLSLEGDDSIMGRSIVLLDKNFGNDRFACANIEPDKDIIKYANIRKTQYFVAAEFLSDVREVLGIPDWMLTVDTRKTKLLYNGACIQFLIHFKGPAANKIELDFSRLLRIGHVSSPSIAIPGYVAPSNQKKSLHYASCPVRENESKRKSSTDGSSNSYSISASIILVYFIIIPNTLFYATYLIN